MLNFPFALWTWLIARFYGWLHSRSYRPPHRARPSRTVRTRSNKKPAWVLRQLILLSAHLPDAGCRQLAMTFNRVFAHRDVSVSKSFAHAALRDQALAVFRIRKQLRLAVPREVGINQCWGIDLTGRVDSARNLHTVLGILNHGSRRLLSLRPVIRKTGWHLLGYLCFAIGEFGRPRAIRTDNEHCFTGRIFTRGLKLLGIRHQRIDLHCPWQNGRIERLFGTLKKYLKQWEFEGRVALKLSLGEFSDWYNHIRPHQNLHGRTPAEAWDDVDPFHAPNPPKEVRFVQRWDGLLRGFHIRR